MVDNLSSRGPESRYPNGDPFAELSRIIGANSAGRGRQDEQAFDLDLERELMGDDGYEPAGEAPQAYDERQYAAQARAEAVQSDPLDDEFADAFAAEFNSDSGWRAPDAEPVQADWRAENEATAPEAVAGDPAALAEVDLDFGDIDVSDDLPALEEVEETPAPRMAARPSLEDELSAMLSGESAPHDDAPHVPLRAQNRYEPAPAFVDQQPEAEYAASPDQFDDFDPYAETPAPVADLPAEDDYRYDAAPVAEIEPEPEPEPQPAEPDPFAVLAAIAPVTPALTSGRFARPADSQPVAVADNDAGEDFGTVPVAEAVVPQQDDLDLPDLPFEEPEESPAALPLDAEYHFGELAAAPVAVAPAPAAQPVPYDAGYDIEPLHYQDDYTQQVADDALYAEYAGEQPVYADEVPAEAQAVPAEPEPARRRGSGMLIAAAVAGVAIIGGIGAFALSFGDPVEGPAPTLVRADSEPLKVRPENPGGAAVPNMDSQAYQRVTEGAAPAAPAQEKLVTATEEPMDLAARALPENGLPGVDDEIGEMEVAPAKSEERVVADEPTAGPVADQPILAVTPRKVRTMVVRPDGTLVARESVVPASSEPQSALAPIPAAVEAEETAAVQPSADTAREVVREVASAAVDRPAGAQQPSASGLPAPRTVETVRITPESTAAAEAAKPVAQQPAAQPAAEQPVAVAAAPQAAAPVAAPAPRPAAPAAAAPQRETQVAQAAPAARALPAAAAPAATGEWSMQIASQPTAEGAQSTYQDLARRYGGVLAGKGVNIVRADIPGKGTYFRVRIPSPTRNEAISLCERYKAAGGSCFVSK